MWPPGPAPMCARPGYVMIYADNDVQVCTGPGRGRITEGLTHSNAPFIRVNHYPLRHSWWPGGMSGGGLLFVMAILLQNRPQVYYYYITMIPNFSPGHNEIDCIYIFYCLPLYMLQSICFLLVSTLMAVFCMCSLTTAATVV